jgi:hypothetical protein
MKLEEFAEMTINIIRENGLSGYLPTFILPESQEIRAIQGIPADVDHREAIQQVAQQSGYAMQEFFFGVQTAPNQITIGHFRPGQPTLFKSIEETSEGITTNKMSSCDWWTI